MTEEKAPWQKANEELSVALSELRKELAEMRSVLGGVRAQSASSSQSQEHAGVREHPASGFSEQKMTFEEFANETGLRF